MPTLTDTGSVISGSPTGYDLVRATLIGDVVLLDIVIRTHNKDIFLQACSRTTSGPRYLSVKTR